MWGNIGNFADLAKAAEELQKQAASQMQSPATPFTGGFFNMDSLQSENDHGGEDNIENANAKGRKGQDTSTASTPKESSVLLPNTATIDTTKRKPSSIEKTSTDSNAKGKEKQNENSAIDTVKPLLGVTLHASTKKFASQASPSASNNDPNRNHFTLPPHIQESVQIPVASKGTMSVSQSKNQDETPMVMSGSSSEICGNSSFESSGQGAFEPIQTQVNSINSKSSDITSPSEEESSNVPGVDDMGEKHDKGQNDSTEPKSKEDEKEEDVSKVEPKNKIQSNAVKSIHSTEMSSQLTESNQELANVPSGTTMAAAKVSPPSEDKMREQFSSQLQRLEENHQQEQEELRRQHAAKNQSLKEELERLQEEFRKFRGDTKRQREAWKLQKDSLTHELKGTQELLSEKVKAEKKLQESHLKQLRNMEKDMVGQTKNQDGMKEVLIAREQSLQKVQEELEQSRDEYATLKERVKVVAGELKERRAECRTLKSEVDLLKGTNSDLIDKITVLEAQGMDLNKSSAETLAEVNMLRAKVMDQTSELEEVGNMVAAEKKKGEDALAAYKKKAQQSLSVANARTTSAIQGREEAEMEARAARSAADSAMDRALDAEQKGNKAMKEAKLLVSEMETKVADFDGVVAQLAEAQIKLQNLERNESSMEEKNTKLSCELQSVQGQLEVQHKTNDDLKNELASTSTRSNELYEEVERLRRESTRLKKDLEKATSDTIADEIEEKKTNDIDMTVSTKRSAEAETTISMLQEELKDANQAIRELKETLRAAVEERGPVESPIQTGNQQPKSNGEMPLFYAMEKQAELAQARNEIARLAALVGESEGLKQEAIEDMEELRGQLQEAKSKLQRESRRSNPQEERVNLEYLKNVILSFLNAKSLVEKKALLPVIGTVLCLTPQEQSKAQKQLEEDGKISLDSVTNSVMNLRWS